MFEDIIRPYLYTQYNDDDNIRAFMTTYNTMAKNICDWMRIMNLPTFVDGYNSGGQLRWIARGIYGMEPPVLASGRQLVLGAFDTFTLNTVPFNAHKVMNQPEQVVVSDDLFKRIIAWSFYKGDRFYFTIPWLKHRIVWLLTGANGVDVVSGQHQSVSVLFSDEGTSVSVIRGSRELTDSSVYDTQIFNSRAYNQKTSVFIKGNEYEYVSLFKQAFDSRLFHMPFYQPVSVTVVG